MMNENEIKKLPDAPSERTKGDHALSFIRAASGLVPLAGSTISEVVDVTVRAPAEARMADWLGKVTETINNLIDEMDDLTPERLANNAAFTTAVIATSRTAVLTEREEKLVILQSILHTTGSGFILDELLRNTFLAAIDRYTPEHVLLLRRCADSEALAGAYCRYKASRSADIKGNFDSKKAQIELLAPWLLPEASADVAKELFSDLHRDRFCGGSEGWAYTVEPEHDAQVATVRGKEFLRFIFGPVST